MTAIAPYRSQTGTGRDGFGRLVRAEWTKLRTVRGWVVGLLLAPLLTVALGLLYSHSTCNVPGPDGHSAACPAPPTGPGGEAVIDTFYFAHQALAGNGSVTVRLTSLTGRYTPDGTGITDSGTPRGRLTPGVQPWSKAGIMVSASTAPGSAYAAVLATGGNGVRMQWNYTGDSAGLPGAVSASSPRWLRLSRSGDTVTGYDSPDGTHWTQVNRVILPGLPSPAQVGLFATSPGYTVDSPIGAASGGAGGPSMATGTFDNVHLAWAGASPSWTGTSVGGAGSPGETGPTSYAAGPHSFTHSGGVFTVTGSGDIAPDLPENLQGLGIKAPVVLEFAGSVGLLPVIIVAALFVTAEYRRGLIRLTFAASPRRGRVLAAKAVVIGLVTFVAGLASSGIALTLGIRLLRAGGNAVLPLPPLTQIRIIVGFAATMAAAAVLAVALGILARRGVTAVTAVIAVTIVPIVLATLPGVLSPGVQDWLLRVTPPAALAVTQNIPSYHQVIAQDTPPDGYFPLAWWAGLAVLGAWAVIALACAAYTLRRRDV
jgi:ABC-type transport system involved in multi-copper enzyme maturation permease subunit